jgi:hypothetical protein
MQFTVHNTLHPILSNLYNIFLFLLIITEPDVGASQGDDLLYIFKLPMFEVFSPGQPEIEIINELTVILADFVNFG